MRAPMFSGVEADIMYTSACRAAISTADSDAPARKKRGPPGWTGLGITAARCMQ